MPRKLFLGLAFTGIAIASVALALIVTAPGASRTSNPDAGPTSMSLAAEPEARLQIPSSRELFAGGHDSEWSLESGPLPAISQRLYGVDSTWEEVVAYFDTELKELGWRHGGCSSGLATTGEWDVEAWHLDNRILRLGNRRRDIPPDAGIFVTYYTVALIGKAVPSGCIDSDETE